MSTSARKYHDKEVRVTKNKAKPKYILRLFVSGILQNSVRAITNLKMICEQHLKGDYELEIIDIYQQPALAITEQIIVIPVMIVKFPLPERRIIGDLSNTAAVLEILNLN